MTDRLLPRLAQALVAVALVALIAWPAAATVLAAFQTQAETGTPSGGGLLAPLDPGTGGVRRPLGLAFETARLVLATEILALPVGLPLAFLLFRTDAWGARPLIALLALAALVPMPLHAGAWIGAFGNAGRSQVFGAAPWLVGWPGAAAVYALAALPWIVLLAGVGFRGVERELEEAALLDRPAWRVVARVSLRRGLGAALAAALAVAVLSAGDMTVTDLLQVRTYAEEAYLQYNLGNGPAAAGAVALPPLLLLGTLVAAGATSLMAADPARLGTGAGEPKSWRLGPGRVPVGVALWILAGGLFVLPIYGLVWRAGRVGGEASAGLAPSWSWPGFAGSLSLAWDDASGPLLTSLALSAVVAGGAALLAWSLAWLGRGSKMWRSLTAASVALALAAPGPVAGMALVYAYRDWPALYDSAGMIVLAGLLRTFPYALLVLWTAVRTMPVEWLEGAALDGLGPARRVMRVGLPATAGALAAAWSVAFVLALGELPATNLVAPPGLTPLSVAIWGLLHTGVESHLAAVVLITLAATAAAGALAVAALAGPTLRWRKGSSVPPASWRSPSTP